MNSMIRGAVVGLTVLLSAQAAQAQGISFGFGGGVVVPTGDLGDANSMGYSGTAQVRVKPPVSPLGFQVDAFYTRFGLEGVDGHSQMLGGTANAVFAFPSASPVRPYLLGGVGLYNLKASIDGLGSTDSQTKFGLNAGAGFDFGLGKAQLFAEGRFHTIMKAVPDVNGDEKAGYIIPLTVGVRF
ncbi:MAG TPA: outer membrane beta-barrel protein [Gemmatimonadales bacterium]|nr:outer membrane beta-barrel protein [Gemmatimonadales bacterium]